MSEVLQQEQLAAMIVDCGGNEPMNKHFDKPGKTRPVAN
jgi:hypothetical protein